MLAGSPNWPFPTSRTSPNWARRIYEEHLGPAPLPFNRLTADRLIEGLRALSDSSDFTARAASQGESANQHHGVRDAVAVQLGPGQ
ncbi:hypothetical protein [Actinomadura geliboluensis]